MRCGSRKPEHSELMSSKSLGREHRLASSSTPLLLMIPQEFWNVESCHREQLERVKVEI